MLRKTLLASLTSLTFLAVATLLPPTSWQTAAASQDAPSIQVAADQKPSGRRCTRRQAGARKGGAAAKRSPAASRKTRSGKAHMIDVERQGDGAFSAAPAKR
ncbi:MAG: hypothetical protein QME75_08830 [Deltaproteobacteria bacterium]|nr:hypothetical protein [Deltaproteobacteria bacterium]